jgi:soluble lytic murein transglycosylase-like protein
MHRRRRQLGALVVLVALAASASSQTAHYTDPAASVGDDFSAYHQDLTAAADVALANLARDAQVSSQTAGVATHTMAQSDATTLHQFARQYWDGNDAAVRRAVARLTQLRPVLTPILQEESIPDEIAALVLVESAGRPTALSPKGARGIWQFMPGTARRYGLTVNGETDDRQDVQKSTRAAARYLKDLYAQFGGWPLALAAYNAGEQLVRNAVLKSGARDFVRLSNSGLLPAETREYVPAVLAASTLLGGDSLTGSSTRQIRGRASVLYASSTSGGQQ